MKLPMVIVILLSMTLRNLAYGLIDGAGKYDPREEYDNSALELVDVTSRSDLNVIKIKRLKCGRRLTADPKFTDQTSNLLPIVFHSTDYEEKGKYPKKANCFSVLELPRDTALYIEWIDMDIETPKEDKCQGDYLRIKVNDEATFYCGTLNGTKLLKMGPFDGTFTRKIKISFRSDNDGERGRGVKLYLYTNKQSTLVLVTTGRILNGTAPFNHAMSSSEVIDMLNPSKKCNISSLPSARFWAKGDLVEDKQTNKTWPMICGGWDQSLQYLKSCYKLDLDSNNWSFTTDMTMARIRFGYAYLNGLLWITGGRYSGGIETNSTDLVSTTSVSPGPELPYPRSGHCMVNLPDGQIVIVGGHEDTLIMSRTLFYDPITSIFSEGPPFPEDLDLPLDFPKCAFFYSKKHGNRPVIFVAHGAKPGNNSAWILDYTNSTTWEKVNSPPETLRPLNWDESPVIPSITNDGVYVLNHGEFFEVTCNSKQCKWKSMAQKLTNPDITDVAFMYLPPDFQC